MKREEEDSKVEHEEEKKGKKIEEMRPNWGKG